MNLLPLLLSQKVVCIKLSGQAFGNDQKTIFNHKYINELASAFATLKNHSETKNIKFIVVVGAGNIWRGTYGHGSIDNVQSDYMGMLATNLNGIYFRELLTKNGVAACMISSLAIERIADGFTVERALSLLEKNNVLIISSGTGLPHRTTDSATEKYARKLGAKVVIIGKNGVNSIYDSDPNKNKKAHKIKKTTFRWIYKNKLNIIDLCAVKKYINSQICAVVININDPQNLVKLFMNQLDIYSVITN